MLSTVFRLQNHTFCDIMYNMANKNIEKLEEFSSYCKFHPEMRFWQALRNWAGVDFIFTHNGSLRIENILHDTFYDE